MNETSQITKEFLSTVYIVNENKVLLTWNKKVCRWIPLGGHIESNELPCDSVIREAKEESGFDIELIDLGNLKIKNLPQNFDIQLDIIKPDHHHINISYIGRIIGGSMKELSDEGTALKWFSPLEINMCNEIFSNTKEKALKSIVIASKMTEKNIEVELRSFISKEKYEELLNFFMESALLKEEDSQETHYLNSEIDLRIQKNKTGTRIWMKRGKIHDDARKETEIVTGEKEDFDKLKDIFSSLGLGTEIVWIRDRKQFEWEGVTVCLDYTKGYGYILEFEKMSTEEEKDENLKELTQKFKRLEINITPKEEFSEKYDHYKQNWRELIK